MSLDQYKITPEEKITLGAVKKLTLEGNDITLTPHIGNIWRANMAVADLGARIVVYEGNCHHKDTDELPGHLRKDGQVTALVDETRALMSTHLEFRPGLDLPYLKEKTLGKTPAQVHFNAMQRVLPPEQVVLSAEYFYTSDPEVRAMLMYLAEHHHIFNRQADLTGLIATVEKWEKSPREVVDDFMKLKRAQIDAVLNGTKPEMVGPLASNRLNVMMLGIKAFLEKRKRGALSKDESVDFTAYALSGRSMINYTKDASFKAEVSEMYAKLQAKFDYLPQTLTLKMLPGSNLRFATAPNEELYEVFRMIGRTNAELEQTQERITVASRNGIDGDKQTAISAANEVRQKLYKLIDQVWAAAPWDHFYSQHDALCNGGRTAIPEEMMGMNFQKLGIVSTPNLKKLKQ